jgi:uncharacterized OB-fold protein
MVMTSIIALVTLVSAPPLFMQRCPKCSRRNRLDRKVCKHCGAEMPSLDL